MVARAIRFDDNDNVIVLTEDVKAGDVVVVPGSGDNYTAQDDIPKGHKMSIYSLHKNDYVIKFGIRIGRMMNEVVCGSWVSEHNLEDVTSELAAEYKKAFREDVRMIRVYPRADGRFGIRNYVMVISAAPECNAAAEAISDATGCAWMVCDRPHLENGRVSEYSRKALGYTGCNPNIYAALVLGSRGEKETADFVYQLIGKTGKPLRMLDAGADQAAAVKEGTAVVRDFMSEAAAQKRELRPIEGLTVTVHCSGSDWTTTVAANPSAGKASDLLIKDGGRVLMSEWEGYCGNEHIMAARCVTRDLGLKLLDRIDYLRELVLKETGRPIEYMNPHPVNKKGGITTLVEKSHGTITKCGTGPIQGILEYCEQPKGSGVWLPIIDNLAPPTSAIYGSLHGAHIHILISGAGYLYYEVPHMVGIRVTGNEETFFNPEYKMDFNAGAAFEEGLSKTGEKLYQYILDIAEGKAGTKSEADKQKVLHMWYYVEDEFGKDRDVSKRVYCHITDYAETVKKYTDYVK